jgi:hypothetical protein
VRSFAVMHKYVVRSYIAFCKRGQQHGGHIRIGDANTMSLHAMLKASKPLEDVMGLIRILGGLSDWYIFGIGVPLIKKVHF